MDPSAHSTRDHQATRGSITSSTSTAQGGGGGAMRSPGLANNAEKRGKNAENVAKNAIENAVLLEWCLPLETPMFRLVLHNWELKAWTV